MQLEKETRQKIIRDILISLFIYALPVVLMFLSFYVTGNKPWLKQTAEKFHSYSFIIKIGRYDKNSRIHFSKPQRSGACPYLS